MRIDQTVFGVFHHFELAHQLQRRGHLRNIYSTWPWTRLKREGLPRGYVGTFPWLHTPETAMLRFGLHSRWLQDQIGYANALAFDAWTATKIRHTGPPDALIAISGSSLKTGRKIQAQGGVFICDRGSSHQRYQDQIVSNEYARWGVQRPVTDIRDTLREEKIYEVAPSTPSVKRSSPPVLVEHRTGQPQARACP